MKSTIRVALVAALFLALAGCGTEGKFDSQIAAVQAASAKICKFLPTAASVAAILTAGNPAVTGVAATAAAICAAVTVSNPVTLFGMGETKPKECPKVNGVCVEGEFIDKDK